MKKKGNVTALYERLSRDDELQGESYSISNQKKLLRDYALQNGFTNLRDYTDDGISGLRFDRPGFMQMMGDVESGDIGTIIVKDMSRLGRDYLKVGQCTEMLRQKGIRLISVNEGTDTFKAEDDFAPFRFIMNEWYARDTSKKIHSTFVAKGNSGKHVASSPPYGYMKDPDDPEKWIVDPEAAEIVREIFKLTMQGLGPYMIAKKLEERKVPIPGYHQKMLGMELYQSYDFRHPYRWCSSTIVSILSKQEYLGHTVNFKTQKHFKDKKSHYVSEDNWKVFENTQEAIIDQDTFDAVQRIRGTVKRYPNGWGEMSPLCGHMFCADCGGKLYIHRRYNGTDKNVFVCGNYSKPPIRTLCSSGHRIDENSVLDIIRQTLKYVKSDIDNDTDGFISRLHDDSGDDYKDDIKAKKQLILKYKVRIDELENLICKIYEDNITGKLSDNRYDILSKKYEEEQLDIRDKINTIEQDIQNISSSETDCNRFINAISQYDNFEEITPYMVNELIDKIVIHEREQRGAIVNYTQKVEIYFSFIGKLEVPVSDDEELSEEEQAEKKAEMEKLEARRKRLHENYLKRKASGKTREDYEKNKARKNAQKEERMKQNPNTYGIPVNEYKKMVAKA